MRTQNRWLAALCSLLAVAATARPAATQGCVGLPGGRGLLTVGFEGTDGATGRGAAFAYRTDQAAVQLQYRALDDGSLSEDRVATGLQGSARVPRLRIPLCVTAGLHSTAYDNAFHESTTWIGTNPGYRIERHRIGGRYAQVRMLVGIGVGREFRVGEGLSLVPFVEPALVLEREAFRPESGPDLRRNDLAWGASGGVTAAVDWLVLRGMVRYAATHEYSLSSQHNWPVLSLHAGVRF